MNRKFEPTTIQISKIFPRNQFKNETNVVGFQKLFADENEFQGEIQFTSTYLMACEPHLIGLSLFL